MKPIILKADQDGKLLITVDEIQKMVENAYNEGVADGKSSVPTINSPSYEWWPRTVPTTQPNDYRWDITCSPTVSDPKQTTGVPTYDRHGVNHCSRNDVADINVGNISKRCRL